MKTIDQRNMFTNVEFLTVQDGCSICTKCNNLRSYNLSGIIYLDVFLPAWTTSETCKECSELNVLSESLSTLSSYTQLYSVMDQTTEIVNAITAGQSIDIIFSAGNK